MKGKVTITDPNSIPVTLSLTASLGDWKKLRKDLAASYPAWKIGEFIRQIVLQLEQEFEGETELGE